DARSLQAGGPRHFFSDTLSAIQHPDPGIADLDMIVAAAQLLKTDVAPARAVLYGQRGRAVVAFDRLRLLVEVQVLNRFAIESHFEARTPEQHAVFVSSAPFHPQTPSVPKDDRPRDEWSTGFLLIDMTPKMPRREGTRPTMSCKPGSPDPASWIYVVVYKSPANGGASFETRTVPRRNPPPVQSNSTIQAHQAGVAVGHRR